MNLIKRLFERMARLANEAAETLGLVGLTNELTHGEWIQLTPYGDFPHAQGMQRVNKSAAEAMANHFNGILASAKRALFGGLPFYIGHPDVPTLANEYPDKKAYGWIQGLEAREDGLYGKVEWTPRGKETIANKEYKFFSPYWDAKHLGVENAKHVYQPVQLLSVGLTNTPNLPVRPLANVVALTPAVLTLLGLANDATAAQISEAVTTLKTSHDEYKQAAHEAAQRLATELANVTTERAARVALLLDNAIRDKQITIAQRAEWETKFANDFGAAQTALAASKVTNLPTDSQTKDLGKDKRTFDNAAIRRAQVNDFITAKMANGMNYDDAWILAKKELAPLFQAMAQK